MATALATVTLSIAIGLGLGTAPASAASYNGYTTFVAVGIGRPTAIVAGADGNLWFTNPNSRTIGRVTPGGALTLRARSYFAELGAIAPGPGGTLWFAHGDDTIGRLTLDGSPDNSPMWWFGSGRVRDIAAGPDGRMWFTNEQGAVGVITSTGLIHRFLGPQIKGPQGIVSGPGNALWYANRTTSSIGRITFTGVVQTPFTDPGIDHPTELSLGPDGNVWFVNGTTSSVGRITAAGVVTTFPYAGPAPVDITAGPDGNLWLTLDSPTGTAGLARVTTEGAVTLLDGAVGATNATAGPDGNVWFVSPSTNRVGRSTPAGDVSIYAEPLVDGAARVAIGADDNAWYTNRVSRSIVRLTDDGTMTAFTDAALVRPDDITRGPDDNLWFTDAAAIGRISAAGAITLFTDATISDPREITTGPDGNLWFTNHGNDTIGRISTNGVVASFTSPDIHGPQGITVGADGNVWFTNTSANTIGRLTPAGVVTAFGDPQIAAPGAIVAGPDGDLWFANGGDGAIRRINDAGVVSAIGSSVAVHANDLLADSAGRIWWAGRDGVGLLARSSDGTWYPSLFAPLGGHGAGTGGLALGPQADIWFADPTINVVGSVGTALPDTYVVTATPGPGRVTLRWNAEIGIVGSLGYVVTPYIDGIAQPSRRAPGQVNLMVINGLAPGTSYRFTVAATNYIGAGVASHLTAPVTPEPFIDVAPGAPFVDDVGWVVGHGIAAGDDDGTFQPTAPVSRQASAVFLQRFADGPLKPAATCAAAPFVDVPADATSCGEIRWMADHGLTKGHPDGTFRPRDPVSRQALAAFLYRAAGQPLGPQPPCAAAPIADVPVDAPFCGEIAWLLDRGIAHGYPDGTFRPTADVSRQAMAALLHRLDAEVHP